MVIEIKPWCKITDTSLLFWTCSSYARKTAKTAWTDICHVPLFLNAKILNSFNSFWANVLTWSHLKISHGEKRSKSSPLEVFLWKGVLKICSKFTREHKCRIFSEHLWRTDSQGGIVLKWVSTCQLVLFVGNVS